MKTLPLAALAMATAAAAAAQEPTPTPTLTVYTYDSFVTDYGPGPAVTEAFEAECGCALEFVAAGDGAALLGRLRLEGDRSPADVVLGLDANLMAEAEATGLFAPHGITPAGLDVPGGWDDATFLPYDWGWFAFVYDETRLPSPPDSFAALLEAPEDVTLIVQDPRTSTPGLGLLMWVKTLYGDEAPEVWAKLAPRIVTVTRGWWEGYSAFLEGESAMVLSYTTSPAYHIAVENDATKKAAAFSEGHYVQVEVAGRLASSDQPELAQRFLRFMLTEGFQAAIPTTNWMYPAVPLADGLPDAFDGLVRPETSLMVPPADAPAVRAEALEEWRDALSR